MSSAAEAGQALRSLARAPAHTVLIVVILALAVGACAGMFSTLSAMLFQPLPYAASDRLVQVYNIYPRATSTIYGTLSIPDYLDRSRQAEALASLAIYRRAGLTLGRGEAAERMRAARVSASMVSTLGVSPLLGRGFSDDAMRPGEAEQVIVSHALWRDRFDGDPGIIGQRMALDGVDHTVIGVMPRGFYFPDRETSLWLPFVIHPEQRLDSERKDEFSQAVGRLRDGATISELNRQFDAIASRNIARAGSDAGGESIGAYLDSLGLSGRATPLREWRFQDYRGRVLLLNAAVALLLLIAIANVTNLHLVRMLQRRGEWAVRSAMGATLAGMARLQAIESLWLGLGGLLLGASVAVAVGRVLQSAGFGMPGWSIASLFSPATLACLVTVTAISTLVGALLPLAVLRRLDSKVLRESGRGLGAAGPGIVRVQAGLIVSQTGLAFALLVSFLLMLQGFQRLQQSDPGFETEGLSWAYLELPAEHYGTPARQRDFYARLQREFEASVGRPPALVSQLPLSGGDWNEPYVVESRIGSPGEPPLDTHVRVVSPAYLETMGIGLLAGRWFDERDDHEAEPVAVVDRHMAETIFAGDAAVGRRVQLTGNRASEGGWRRIVGVVEAVRHLDLGEPVTNETLYLPLTQQPLPSMMVVARDSANGAKGAFVPALRRSLAATDPEIIPDRSGTMADLIDRALGETRAPMQLLLAFGLAALLLAGTGIHAVMNFVVVQRTRELGLRSALGASRATLVLILLRRGIAPALLGCALGIPIVGLLVRYLAIPGASGASAAGISSIVLLALLASSLLACLLPARKIANMNAGQALLDRR